MDRRRFAGVVVAGIAGAAWPLEHAAEAAGAARSDFRVGARVAGTAALEGLNAPATVRVSETDRATGRVAARVTLTVRTNDAAGYLVTLWPRADWFESVRIGGPGGAVELPADGGAVVRRTSAAGVDRLELDLTFHLREDVVAGEWPWPVAFGVTPL
jgi:hypothetical protein